MSKITPCLWFDGDAEEAANFYISLLPDSRIERTSRAAADFPGGSEGVVLTVDFTVAGQPFMGLNGGPESAFSEAVSFTIACTDQEEVDRLWDTLTADGGRPIQCGWLKDKFGLAWQIVPKRLPELFSGPDRDGARRAMQAMMEMVKLDIATLERAYQGAEVI